MTTIQSIPDPTHLFDLGEILRIFWNQTSRVKVNECMIIASRPRYFDGIEYFISLSGIWPDHKAGLLIMVDDLHPLTPHKLTNRLLEEIGKKRIDLEKMLKGE